MAVDSAARDANDRHHFRSGGQERPEERVNNAQRENAGQGESRSGLGLVRRGTGAPDAEAASSGQSGETK